jgi:hypothetical protein
MSEKVARGEVERRIVELRDEITLFVESLPAAVRPREHPSFDDAPGALDGDRFSDTDFSDIRKFDD